MEVSGQVHAPAALPLGKESRYPFDRKLNGPHSRSGCCGEEGEKKNSALPFLVRKSMLYCMQLNIREKVLDDKI
jgi:hypothetical protein